MKKSLEQFPNELFLEVFKYFSTEELFQVFYNLNHRLNLLIQSLDHLSCSSDHIDPKSCAYIRHLKMLHFLPTELARFVNLRSLNINGVDKGFLCQLDQFNLSQIESLSLHFQIHPYYMSFLTQMVFTNRFPNIKYCYISRMKSPEYYQQLWTQTDSLRYLKLRHIDVQIYRLILSSCPNLYSLKCKLSTQSKVQSNSILHSNLKRLNLDLSFDHGQWSDQILDECFSWTSRLQQLKINRSFSKDMDLSNYDWLQSILSSRLMGLEQFLFRLSRSRSQNFVDFEEVSNSLKKNFFHLYQNRYQFRLIVH